MMAPAWLPLVLVGVVISAVTAVLKYQQRTLSAAFCGGLGALLFVAVAVVCRMETGDRLYAIFVIAGLSLHALGNLVIDMGGGLVGGRAKGAGLGIALLLLGHTAYLAALIYRGFIAGVIALPLAVGMMAVVSSYMKKHSKRSSLLRALGVTYLLMPILVICWSIGLVILNLPDSTYHLFLLGALGLLILDFDLLFKLLKKGAMPMASTAAYVAYFTGELLLSLSILFA